MDQWRVTVLGDGGVGKTALAVQFTMNAFVETYDPTIEDSYRKQILVDGRMCFIEVIDTAGQEEYATLRDQWVREGEGFVLVYSTTSENSFARLQVFYASMRRVKRIPPILILIGNKCDQSSERQVSEKRGQQQAAEWGCRFLETSAKTPINVDEAFVTLVRTLRHAREQNGGAGGGAGPGPANLNAPPPTGPIFPPQGTAELPSSARRKKKDKKNGRERTCIIA